jgi:hypothetical protein
MNNYQISINNTLQKYKDLYNSHNSSILIYQLIIKSCEFILKIIDNKNDEEFNEYYINNMSNLIKFNKYYFVRFYKPYKELKFNSFNNLNEFIDISYNQIITDENFYNELNSFLETILNNHKNNNNNKNQNKKEILTNFIIDNNDNKNQNKKEILTNFIIDNNDNRNKNKRKTPILATMRRLVWDANIGEEVGKAKCLCCKTTDITQLSFNCGHIIAEANGGDTTVSNLRPICQNCNSSMGTRNMDDFMRSLK